jgi:hypothetical protein
VRQLCGTLPPALVCMPLTRHQQQRRSAHVVLHQAGEEEEPVLALGPANARPAGQVAAKLGSGIFVGTFKGGTLCIRGCLHA